MRRGIIVATAMQGAGIGLSSTSIGEAAAIGATVGVLSVSGGTGTYTFTLTSNPGGLFAISGSNLNVAAALTPGVKPITVQAAGGVPTPLSQAFAITVTATVVTPPASNPTYYFLGF
jgi:hypothetical protein